MDHEIVWDTNCGADLQENPEYQWTLFLKISQIHDLSQNRKELPNFFLHINAAFNDILDKHDKY